MTNNKNLFLDDERLPSSAYLEKLYDNPHDIYIDKEWLVVENFEQFVDWIKVNGIPKTISFDHDLAPSHYTPKRFWNNYEKSKEWQEAQVHNEPTGLGCVVWLISYCIKHKLDLPTCYCHSANPVGRDKILSCLTKNHLSWKQMN